MQFIVYTEDRENGLPIRQANRDAHVAWLKDSSGADVLAAGPWLDNDGIMRGSLLIVETIDRSALDNWFETDPYKQAGLPSKIMIKPYKWVIGAPN